MSAREATEVTRYCSGRDVLLLAIMVCGLAKSGETLADPIAAEHEFGPANGAHDSALGVATEFGLPKNFTAASAPRDFSATEFSSRKGSTLDAAAGATPSFADSPGLRTTTVWQQLADYRAHDRIRLVTLWETAGSTLSIQAGKRGEPSLQWTSRAMNRGGATRGLLDRMISASLGSAGAGVGQLRSIVRPAQPTSPAKPLQSPQPILAKTP